MEAQPNPQTPGTISLDPRYTDTAFTRVPNWVMERLGTISRDARYTFIVLLKYARQDGHCWPGMDKLTADLGASRQSVHHWIKELEMVGLIEVVRRGMGRSNDYIFHWPDWLDADVNHALPDPSDVKQSLHQGGDVKQGLRLDVKQGLPPDVKQAFPYVDAPTKTHGPLVPPVDIAKHVDTSARNARAREARPSLSKSDVDPLEGWVQKAIGAIQIKRGEADISGRARDLWARAVQKTLGHLSQDERDAYIHYLLSDGYIPSRSSPKAVADAVEDDYPTWERMGRPRTKNDQGKSGPKVPTHIQRERDLAYKGKTRTIDARSSPEEIAATFEELRKYQGEERARRWLEHIHHTGT